MTPGKTPPPLEYRAPPLTGNSPVPFILQVIVGAGATVACAVVGVVLLFKSDSIWLLFIPQLAPLLPAIYVACRHRRYGYVAGVLLVILGVFFLGLLLALLVVPKIMRH